MAAMKVRVYEIIGGRVMVRGDFCGVDNPLSFNFLTIEVSAQFLLIH